MKDFLHKLFKGEINSGTPKMTPDEVARFLKTTPEALKAFEDTYRLHAGEGPDRSHVFGTSARQAADMIDRRKPESVELDEVCARIVKELLSMARVWAFDGKTCMERPCLKMTGPPVTQEELSAFPEQERPQLTGDLVIRDMPGSSLVLLSTYAKYQEETDPKKKQMLYHQFRQGLDILDIDPLLYAMLGTNPNAIGYWLPAVAETAAEQSFFKIPKTTVVRVPITVLQLTRMDYEGLNATTRRIVNDFCMQAFGLDTASDYFIKTGTYSSKFDFRNSHVPAGKEVMELGEYLLYIQNQATYMAGPLCQPSIYGMSTTNEWAVREYIPDVEDNPCIYKGMPLHTEYRIFVDFDAGKVIGTAPYWDPSLMKKRFSEGAAAGSIHDAHDYAIYAMHEETLMRRYCENCDRVTAAAGKLAMVIREAGVLPGQWSIDVMQNGDDFWLIDMAWAQQSALYDCVPKELRAPMAEDWMPKLNP